MIVSLSCGFGPGQPAGENPARPAPDRFSNQNVNGLFVFA